MRIGKGFIGLVFIVLFLMVGCVSTPKTGFEREKLNVVNLLGYSELQVNIEVAKDIWNNKINVQNIPVGTHYLATYDSENKKIISLYVDDAIEDIDYSLELATTISYFAYIIKNPDEDDLEINALNHAKKTYDAIIKNVLSNNPSVSFNNPRNFKEFLDAKSPEMRSLTVFTFSK